MVAERSVNLRRLMVT